LNEVREAALRLGEPLNWILSSMREGKLEFCAALLADARSQGDALEKVVCDNPVANRGLSGAHSSKIK
jgi:hypothetical protein